jgi:hypothetical protein
VVFKQEPMTATRMRIASSPAPLPDHIQPGAYDRAAR